MLLSIMEGRVYNTREFTTLARNAICCRSSTGEAHRGKGYATRVSGYVIDQCLARGFSVAWSCETDNPASAAIARRQEFQKEGTDPALVYSSTRPRPSETAQ
jgi:RimJ/RimL family protein N-acetyltransferase